MKKTQDEPGLFFELQDLTVLFSLVKSMEDRLSQGERNILIEIEKTLYEHLSIKEVAKLISTKTGA
ncbi:hypothetical protein [Breznakiella homolactica]|uniref:HTH luxR-type domain-containing protein n=1 Tax=Breznakiella homolactica TaxID=2798577 RepID=A0A7T8B9B0_9SPIR|nr:hypothetical protein [Breznakiella homolactica]QQO08151.1 hypothetical protein JFL75_14560 [Breznakiella homolactica]